MIKILKGIRQKLMIENKLSRYLIYAVGEIILVVIGILIALSINNRNQYSKDRAIELSILHNLSNDLEQDSIALERLFTREEFVEKNIDSVFSWLFSQNESAIYKILEKLEFVGNSSYFYPNTGTFDESTSSGLMNTVLNDSLRSDIFKYYRLVRSNRNDLITDTYQTQNIVPDLSDILFSARQVVQKIFNRDNPNLDNITVAGLYQNPKFSKVLTWRKVNSNYLVENWRRLMTENSQLSFLIKKEIIQRTN